MNWRQTYSDLTDYVARHPDIKIGIPVTRIPGEHSAEFHSLHLKSRIKFIEEEAPDILEKSLSLSKNYKRVEEEVIGLIGLKGITLSNSLHRFLHNPVDQLTKENFNALFDLLRGQTDIEKYKVVALQNIETAFNSLHRSVYEKWVILSLVALLKADRAFRVIPEEVTEDDTMRHGGKIEYKIPAPEESDIISFKRDREVGFMVPDLIVHSTNSDRYYSFTSEIIKALAAAINPSNRREWLPGDPAVVFEGGTILIYVDRNLEDLSLVTDMKRTCRADLVLECREQKDWYKKGKLDKIRKHYDKYEPRMGTYIVTMDQMPEQLYNEFFEEGALIKETSGQSPGYDEKLIERHSREIQLLHVGYDQMRLKPIVNILECC